MDRTRDIADHFITCLDEAERARAARFHFDRDTVSFVLTRAHLRLLLGKALGLSPAAVRFDYGPGGKPLLPPAGGLWFNVSHSGGFAAIAIATDRVGVDVERMRPIDLSDSRHYFSTAECQGLAATPAAGQHRAFFRCWSRKEAYLKGRGDGIGFGLDRFTVTVDTHSPPRLVHVEGEPREPERWQIADVEIHPEYSGAVALEHPIESLQCWDIEIP